MRECSPSAASIPFPIYGWTDCLRPWNNCLELTSQNLQWPCNGIVFARVRKDRNELLISFGGVYSKELDKKTPKKERQFSVSCSEVVTSELPLLAPPRGPILHRLVASSLWCFTASHAKCRSEATSLGVFSYFQYWVMHRRHRFCSWQGLLPIMRIRLTFSCCVSSWDWSLLEAGNTEIVGHNVCIIVCIYIICIYIYNPIYTY